MTSSARSGTTSQSGSRKQSAPAVSGLEQIEREIMNELLSNPSLHEMVVWLAGAGNEAYLRRREARQLAELWPKGWPQRLELETVQ